MHLCSDMGCFGASCPLDIIFQSSLRTRLLELELGLGFRGELEGLVPRLIQRGGGTLVLHNSICTWTLKSSHMIALSVWV